MNYYLEGSDSKIQKKEKAMNTKLIIYLGELPPKVDQYELNQFILSQGKFNIESLYVKTGKENKSFAYVKFKTSQEAMRAIRALHLKPFKDYIIKAEPFKQNGQTDKSKNEANLFIKNLPLDTTPKDLYDLFCKFGTIISINLKHNDQGKFIGYGYVNFEQEKSAADAINALNRSEYKDKILTVSLFTPHEKRIEGNNDYLNPMILIKNLPEELAKEENLTEVFANYGNIVKCGIIDNEKLGVIIFSKKEETESAFLALNNKPFDSTGKVLELTKTPWDNEIWEKIKKAKQELFKKKYDKCNLVVKNLPQEVDDKSLLELFRKYGDISSARVQREHKMKEIKDKNGEVVDKELVYQSKGYGFVLFKNPDNAKEAKEELNEKETEFKGMKLKLQIDYYDYSKGEKSKIAEIQREMNPHAIQHKQYQNKRQHHYYNQRGGYNKNKNRQLINPPNRFDNGMQGMPQGIPQGITQQQMYKMPQQQMGSNFHANQNPFYNSPPPSVQQEQKITVEGEGLVEKVKNIFKIEDPDDRTETLGDTLFYFLLKFIPQYKLNITEGRLPDSSICSKLTGILIKTDFKNLIEIISNSERLERSLRDVLLKLMQTQRLEA